MIQATLTNRAGAGQLTVSLTEDTVIGMTITVSKRVDVEDQIRPASVHVYRWQGLPDKLDDLKALAETAYWIATRLDQQLLTIEDFDKPWRLYRTGIENQTLQIEQGQPA